MTRRNLTPVGYSISSETVPSSISNGAILDGIWALPFVSDGLLLWMDALEGVVWGLVDEGFSEFVDEAGSAILNLNLQST